MSEKTQKRKPRRWRRRLIILGVIGLVGAVAGVEVTSLPRFCNSCHIMKSYYASWQEDVHNDVPCVDCHIAPGADNFVQAKLNGLGQVVDDWLNRTSSKPSASVSDLSCGRNGCHNIDSLKAKNTTTDAFMFKHGKHLGRTYRGIAIHCSTCHSHVRGEQHFEVNTNVCVTCHLIEEGDQLIVSTRARSAAPDVHFVPVVASNGGFQWPSDTTAPTDCRKCHIPPQEPFTHQEVVIDHQEYLAFGAMCESCHVGVTAPPQSITDAECLQCHIFGVEQVKSTEEVHRQHTEGEHKVECFSCHGVTRHGPVAESMSMDRLECRDCHTGQHAVQRATYLQPDRADASVNVTASAISPMFLVHVGCTGCHVEPGGLDINPNSGATVARAVPAACDACHQEGIGERMIPMWQHDTRQLYDEVLGLLPGSGGHWNADCPEATSLVEEAERLLELVRLDGSWGVHNPRYTERLIEQARVNVLEARGLCRSVTGGDP